MTISYHERPGVYSDYTASSVYVGAAGGKTVGLAASSAAQSGLYTLNSMADADAFSADARLCVMLRLLFQNGAGTVLVCPVAETNTASYTAAFRQLLAARKAKILLSDSADIEVASALKASVEAAQQDRNECVAVVCTSAQTDAARIADAAALNSARVLVAAPESYADGEGQKHAAYTASAIAGLLAGQLDPALPLSGAELEGLTAVDACWTEDALDLLIGGGVTPLELQSGSIRIVRGVSSKTTENGAPDTTWKEFTTILTVDDVITGVRSSLQRRFTRAKNNAQTRSAIRDQVVLELESRIRREIIEHYGDLSVTANAEDPTVCDVIFSFGICHGLRHILLTAHITV